MNSRWMMLAVVLCACATSFGTISFSSNTLTYSSPSDLGTTIDPSGQMDVASNYGVTKASFQALNPQVVAFNGAPAPTQTLRTLVAYYDATHTVTFTFPSAMYNYGSMTTLGRGSFSGSAAQDAISTVPSTPDSLNDWFDATITSTGGRGVQSLGFCVAFRNDQAVPAGQALFTLSDATTAYVTLPALGGSGNPEYVFIGYTAPTGKTITRVQASRASTVGGAWVSVDDLSFVMSAAPDTTAPAAVSNLSSSGATASSVTLTWTAPGDDGSTGTATTYDIRYSTSTITTGNWSSATQVSGEPAPQVAGTNQNMTVSGLAGDTTYYFAMETADEVPNWSALSNVYSRKTSDTVAPAAVSNLATSSPTNNSITLTWTAPGDNGSTGTATSYDIRYSTSQITNDTQFNSATQCSGEPTPLAAGNNQSFVVSGLSANTTYYFAIKTSDEVPNVSAISNSPSGTTSGTITFVNNTLTYGTPSDLGTTIDPAGLNDVATSYGITKASFQALNPQVVGFNGAPAPTQTLRTLVAYYNPSNTVTFTFPSAMYNYGSMTTVGRGAFSGASLQDAISTVPTQPDSLYDWFDATITSTGGQGVKALGFCVGFRNDQAVPAGQVLYTLSDATTDTVTLPALGGAGNPEYVFIGYQAPSGKTIARVQASRTSGAGGGWVSVDDLAFVMGTADTTAPAAVSNLSSSGATASSVTLTWTAPGDDGSTGTATTYDIRYSTSTITAGNWSSATQVSGEPAPQVAGTNQNMTVSGLAGDTTYYFAMETADEVPNWSALSNVYSRKTSDTVAPAAVSNLATSSPTASSIVLSWTAPGDNGSTGTATTYDIRYSTSTITAGNWASATQVTGEPAPLAAGTNQNMTITGLSADTTYYFAIETADEVPNWSAISNVPSGKTSDTVAPAAVSNLATGSPTSSSITLTWTAPGDNGSTGTATTYDIRYSTSAITAGNWASATQVSGEPAPLAAGNNQSMVISGLNPSTTYYFAIETADEVPNWSALSNVPSGTTSAGSDTTAPAAVSNLAAGNATNTSITLTWTAPGDDGNTGTATTYDIRYSTSTINTGNWASATQVSGEPTPLVAGSNQSMTINGLTANTTYYFAMKTADEVPNWSGLSNVPSGTTTNGSGNNKPILGQSDFVYQGYYIVQHTGDFQGIDWGRGGFTHRYVGGQLRFLTLCYSGAPNYTYVLVEFAPPGSYGGTVTTRTNFWGNIWAGTGTDYIGWMGLWYEAAANRLWTAAAVDYPDDTQGAFSKALAVRTLNSDGTISNAAGPWGLQGIQQRRVYGGVQAVPSWFQTTYGTGPYCAGWGGYASRFTAGGGVSMGPSFYAFPEPTGYPAGNDTIPTSAFKTIMDHGQGQAITGPDWYPNGVPTSFDRGVRNNDVINQYDTPNWQSPAPDGLGRWTWGDSNWNTGCWIETPSKQGFILVPLLCSGRTWYETSTLHCEHMTSEIQVFDPNMLGQVAQGTRAAWNTYPTNRWEITSTCTPLGWMWGHAGNGPEGGPSGATYDSTTQTLYLFGNQGLNDDSYILVYHVN